MASNAYPFDRHSSNLGQYGYDTVISVRQQAMNTAMMYYMKGWQPSTSQTFIFFSVPGRNSDTWVETLAEWQTMKQCPTKIYVDPFDIPNKTPLDDQRIVEILSRDLGKFLFGIKLILGTPPYSPNDRFWPQFVTLDPDKQQIDVKVTWKELSFCGIDTGVTPPCWRVISSPQQLRSPEDVWYLQSTLLAKDIMLSSSSEIGSESNDAPSASRVGWWPSSNTKPPSLFKPTMGKGDPLSAYVLEMDVLNNPHLVMSIDASADFVERCHSRLMSLVAPDQPRRVAYCIRNKSITDSGTWINAYVGAPDGQPVAPPNHNFNTLNWFCMLQNPLPPLQQLPWNSWDVNEMPYHDGTFTLNSGWVQHAVSTAVWGLIQKACVTIDWVGQNDLAYTCVEPVFKHSTSKNSLMTISSETTSQSGKALGATVATSKVSYNLTSSCTTTEMLITQTSTVHISTEDPFFHDPAVTGTSATVIEETLTDTWAPQIDDNGRWSLMHIKSQRTNPTHPGGWSNKFIEVSNTYFPDFVDSWRENFVGLQSPDFGAAINDWMTGVQSSVSPFPASDSFQVSDAQFSDHGDLVATITYHTTDG